MTAPAAEAAPSGKAPIATGTQGTLASTAGARFEARAEIAKKRVEVALKARLK